MPTRRSQVAAKPPASRSKVSNRSRVHQTADERSAGARRFRDLIEAFSEGLGELSEADLAMVRTAAALTIKSEQLQAALAAGEAVDSDALIRLAGTTRRSLAAISAKRQDKPAPTLADYMAARAAELEEDDEATEDAED
jgi:hypothetical protein